jgi:hypothetical protein
MPSFPLVSPETFGVASLEWRVVDTTSRARNPWTLNLITQVFDGRMWAGSLALRSRNEAEGRALAAWLAALRRPGTNAGTFLLGDPAAPLALGSARTTPGTPVVAGAGQTGEALNVSGLPLSASGYLLAGDYIQIGSGITSRLLMVLDNVNSDGAGLATINTWPGIRTAPSNGSALVVSSPKGLFISPQAVGSWQVNSPVIYDGVTIEVAEVVP